MFEKLTSSFTDTVMILFFEKVFCVTIFAFFSLSGCKMFVLALVRFPRADRFLHSPGGEASAFLLLLLTFSCETNIAALDLI